MQDYLPILFFAAFASIFVMVVRQALKRAAAQRKITIVWADQAYPNNEHIEQVGYYHAAHRRWFPHPWNEFREGEGYYWNGAWHPEADAAQITSSRPESGELSRVNELWCAAHPERAREFKVAVQRFGLGIGDGRREGS